MTRNLLFLLLLLPAVLISAENVKPDFVVTPTGSDASESGPFATPQRAQKAVRDLKAKLEKTPRPIVVHFSEGEYFLSAPWGFDAADSGSEQMPVVYEGEKNAVISGGIKLKDFKPDDQQRWQTIIPEVARGEWSFSELFVNGTRRYRPRMPLESFYFVTGEIHPPGKTDKGDERFVFAKDELNKNWLNLSDVEILTFHNWTMSRMRIKELDEPSQTVTLSNHVRPLARGGRFLVENIFEELQLPGEWYLNNKNGELHYIPIPDREKGFTTDAGVQIHAMYPGESIVNSSVVAPRLERLIDIKGGFTPDRIVSNIHFRNLTFKHCNVKFPANGYSSPQAEVGIPGAIYAVGAQHCSFEHCEISQVGGYGIELTAGCKDNLIDDCDLTDLGAGGIKLGDGRYRDKAHESELAERNTVRNCFLAYGGRQYPAAIGIWLGQTPFNTIEHNEIFDFYYTGLSVGWTWGYGPSNAHDNIFAYNHVHKIGQGLLTDMGAIYSLGVSPGTRIHHNLFHDIESHDYGGWGIYYDEGSTSIVSEDNIVYNCKSAGFHQHYGKENVVRNNIFAFGHDHQLMRTRPEDHLTVSVEGNIIYYKDGDVLGSNWSGGKFSLDHNLYWNAAGQPVKFLGQTLEEWRKKGHDQNSIIEDPLFVDPEHFNFTLKENSPASKIGFKPIDLTGVGPARARNPDPNWPRAFPPNPAAAKPSK